MDYGDRWDQYGFVVANVAWDIFLALEVVFFVVTLTYEGLDSAEVNFLP